MEDAVTCPVCCELYRTGPKEPLVLPCGHAFCRSCLNVVLTNDDGCLACPICRANVGVFDHLPVCFPLLSLSSNYAEFKYMHCKTHDEEERYWCKECRCPLCSLCLYNDHPKGHEVVPARAVVRGKKEDLREELTTLGQDLRTSRGEIREHARQLVKKMQKLCTLEHDLGRLTTEVHSANSLDDLLDCEELLHTIKEKNVVESSKNDINRVLQTMRDLEHLDDTVVMNLMEGAAAVQEEQQKQEQQLQQRTQRLQQEKIPSDECQGLQARLDTQDGRLLVHCLVHPVDTCLSLQLPSEVFLELSVGGSRLGRVYIRLWAHLRRAQQFLALCQGTLGPSYLGASFSHVAYMKQPKETLCCKEYQEEDGTPGKQELLSNLEWGGKFERDPKQGLVIPLSKNIDEHGFGICTRSHPGGTFHCPFGEVVSGLKVVKLAVKHNPVTEVSISQCGMVLPELTP